MKFKTTIEITSEAKNKSEALEIVGEYLAGNIVSGVDMKCRTGSTVICNSKRVVSVALASIMIGCAIFLVSNLRAVQDQIPTIMSGNAIQPPLKTSNVNKKWSEFKKEWQAVQTKEALASIKK